MLRWMLLLLLLLARHAQAGSTSGPVGTSEYYEDVFLWRIEGEKPSYLFGTLHLRNENILALPDLVWDSLRSADAFYGESSQHFMRSQQISDWRYLPEGKRLQDVIGEDLFARFRVLVEAKLYFHNYYEDKNPFFAIYHLYLLDELSRRAAGLPFMDELLAQKAIEWGLEEGGLEDDPDMQRRIYVDWTDEELRDLFAGMLHYYESLHREGRNAMKEHMEGYFRGDLESFHSQNTELQDVSSETYRRWNQRILNDRDERMAARIAQLLRENPGKSYFFAVGTAHYFPESGLQHRLRKMGFKINRMTLKDATPTQTPVDSPDPPAPEPTGSPFHQDPSRE